jgi:KipI family sensor histidine kinase inhibitor
MIDLVPLGDRAWLARFASEDEARGWAASAQRALGGRRGITDIVLAYDSVAVFADAWRIEVETLGQDLAALKPTLTDVATAAHVEIPVLYDGADLPLVARHSRCTEREVIDLHSSTTYNVRAIGFLPGFPYAGPLPDRLAGLARRDTPRPRVPAGSVAIAGRQTCVYPQESPGGWHLLGRTPLRIAEMEAAHFPIRSGDHLRFRPIDAAEFAAREGKLLEIPSRGSEPPPC